MRSILLLATVFVLAFCEEIHGSPVGGFVSECAFAIPAPGPFKVVAHKVIHESAVDSDQTITGHALLIAGAADGYHNYAPHDKCPGVAPTSETAKAHGCVIATNAGSFSMKKKTCIGDIISDGNVIYSDPMQRALFGVTNDGKLVAGYGNDTFIKQTGFKQLVHGRGWIIHNAKSHVDEAAKIEDIPNHYVTNIAPRISIGWNNEGQIILVVIDGEESKKHGLNLKNFANLILKLGAIEAINLDGGGSVTLVWNGHICEAGGIARESCKDIPTATDVPPEDGTHERYVTSITCFK